ncbi:hypothetical protein PMZ80_010458 [Knufia obscura]|uniref:Oxidase FUB9 n=2 Tax=Knufia TaxID=430999 RepID=A0AAN8IHG0_9EURO|nr:hypothetical protein PMZ80_010458 [Knufia obscura]KAK5948007.1 hypothetical protein OHC33_010935 [Knufia fluminis]
MANRKARFDPKVFTISDLKDEAAKKVPIEYTQYFNEGAGDMITLQDNEDAFKRYKLRPRIMKNVDGCDMSSSIFGQQVKAPFGFAPSAAHKLAHPQGELATSRAAAANDIPMCLSSWATTSLEDVKNAGGSNPHAMQVTFMRDVSFTQKVIKRSEAAGYNAIFVSVDLPVLGNRLNESRNDFCFPTDMPFPNLPFDSGDSRGLISTGDLDYDPSIHWEQTVPWLREQTNMDVWLKGVYTAEDVEMAISHGLDGVVISNHGGRQLDGVPATLDALRECAAVGKGRIKIAIDGGIRRGSDIFKALALGADFCFVGRPVIWGLAYAGQAGVDLAAKILMDELRQTMMLCGCQKLSDIKSSHLSMLEGSGILSKL